MASIIPDASLLKRDFFGTEVLRRGTVVTSSQLCHSSARVIRETTTMATKIRLARYGCRNKPFYRIMATDSRSRRDGKHLEILGYYNPLPVEDKGRRMGINFERVKYWLSVGAKPSDTVQRLLVRAGVFSSTEEGSEVSSSSDPKKENDSKSDGIDGSEA